MVCPNCHSEEIIDVQGQHFCISCGQMVPEIALPKVKVPTKVQSNGLPEGVTILPLGSAPLPEIVADVPPEPVPRANIVEIVPASSLIHGRSRLAATADVAPAASKRRKPGRPKAGRLDIPRRAIASNAPAERPKPIPAFHSPEPTRSPLVAAAAPIGPSGHRRMSDLAPRQPRPATPAPAAPAKSLRPAKVAAARTAKDKPAKHPRHHAHKVGVPALHYAPVIAFSLRARARPHLVGLAALGALSLGLASAYGVWQLRTAGLASLADGVLHAGPKLIIEAALLGIIYYIGRSIGQTAIMYGIAREADQRPVTISRQLGIAINTFGRRLRMDIGFGIGELLLIGAGVTLFLTGGQAWPMPADLQMGIIFVAYLVILYLITALAISRGLAGVNLTLTHHQPATAARLGWILFSHRIELIGPRFGALLMEAVLALPLITLAVALVVAAPPQLHLLVAIGAGLLAWLAGALLGVGTAAWWSTLYRQLVMADHPAAVVAMLSARQPEQARRAPLALIVALSTLILAATLILPWLQLV